MVLVGFLPENNAAYERLRRLNSGDVCSTTIITVQLYVSSGPAAGNRRQPCGRSPSEAFLLRELDSEETTAHLRWTLTALTREEALAP